ncbi:MAG: SpoIIE family protein phosphatase [candidate division Zixibacteria bacterium]|nr:SpoIIE family protein phosphatase [candidate division Zixibacteria bacterium]
MDKTAVLLEAAEILNSDLKIESLISNILKLTANYLNARAASIFLVDENSHKLNLFLKAEEREDFWESSLDFGKGIAGWVAENGEPVISPDAKADPRYHSSARGGIDFEVGPLICVPIKRGENVAGVLEALNPSGSPEFDRDDLEIIMALTAEVSIALENARLIEKLEKNSREKELLFEISKKINTFLRLDEVLDSILSSLAEVIQFDAAAIFLVDPETGEIKPEVEKSQNIEFAELMRRNFHQHVGEGLVGWAARTGQSVLVPDVSADERYIKLRQSTRSEMVVPIKNNGYVDGVLNIESDNFDNYNKEDLKLVEAFAGQAAVAIERAHLLDEILTKRRIEEELRIARRIHSTFLPSKQPRIAGFDIYGINSSYSEVGGDYYDYIPIVQGQYGIVISDGSGHGIPAALLMAAFRASLKAEIRNNYAIRHILYKVNNLLCESVESGSFVTAVYGVLDSTNSILTYSNAGHNPPIWIKGTGEVQELTVGGFALGVVENTEYTEKPVVLNCGDIIVFYTDGIAETRNVNKEEFGTDRVVEIIQDNQNSSASMIANSILNELKEFRGDAPQGDDYTIVIMKKS